MDMRFFIKFQRQEIVLCQKGLLSVLWFSVKAVVFDRKACFREKKNFSRKKIEIHSGEIGNGCGVSFWGWRSYCVFIPYEKGRV